MKRIAGGLLTFLALIIFVPPMTVSAHQTIQVGDYALEYGWLNEQPISGQPNAVVINISAKSQNGFNPTPTGNATPGAENPAIDASGLKIEAVYGGEQKVLTLQPLGENTPGQFIAPLTPTLPGKIHGSDHWSIGKNPGECLCTAG